MLKIMFGAPDVRVPSDFGAYVTPRNVDIHLEQQCREVNHYIRKAKIAPQNAEYAASCES
jgi:hypothetical protein